MTHLIPQKGGLPLWLVFIQMLDHNEKVYRLTLFTTVNSICTIGGRLITYQSFRPTSNFCSQRQRRSRKKKKKIKVLIGVHSMIQMFSVGSDFPQRDDPTLNDHRTDRE